MSLSKPLRKFTLPTLYPSKFPKKVNPFQTRPEVEEWLNWSLRMNAANENEFRLAKPIALLTSAYYSNCLDINLYEIAFKLFLSAIIWDDRVESDFRKTDQNEETSLKLLTQLSQLVSKLENNAFVSMIDWESSVIAMFISLDAIYAAFNATQQKHMITIWRDHIKGMAEEYKLVRQLKTYSTVEEMIKVRVGSCGMMPFIQLVEFTNQIQLPKTVREDSRILKLDKLVAQHFAVLNDLVSFEKDYNDTNSDIKAMNNGVAFFVLIKRCSVEDAMKELVEMVKQTEEEIIQIETKILNEENCLDSTKKYINSLNDLVGGQYAMIGLKRY